MSVKNQAVSGCSGSLQAALAGFTPGLQSCSQRAVSSVLLLLLQGFKLQIQAFGWLVVT